ncbi:glycosyltransferase [Intestinimonas massiliensis (ex Afouda et al. 2020)]|uniref:glycosyltransferase n=1 Tax=Intestinimonas massiliensis (ex Afouda et al. 2020) TaxID=1673721 RepID=UPI00103204D2|nr:glycosyltransferase [Intestinimonas massiliensis (ex Afouda et al. 2020)]
MEEPIRILCVFSRLDRGGAENMCMNLYRRMNKDKVQFDFVKHGPGVGAFEPEIRALGGRIYEAPQYRVYNHASYCQWWRQHLKAHPEHRIIHGHYYTISAVYFKEARRLGRITVGHSHSTAAMRDRRSGWLKAQFCKRAERHADYCLACSKPAGEWLFPHRNFTVLNNAIDTEQFHFRQELAEAVRNQLSLGKALVIGTVGNISRAKNPMGVVSIFKALCEHVPEARLLWVGDGSMRSDAEQALVRAGLADRAILTGVRADVDRLMQAMDVFILPSLFEGLGMVLIEAQAAGLPCLCSDTIPREVNVTGRCEFLPLDQPELWVKRILEIPHDRPDTRDALRQAGYDIGTTAKWLEQFYIDCLNR